MENEGPKASHAAPNQAAPGKEVGHVGGCQKYGPLWGRLNTRCRILLRTQEGTIILTITHVFHMTFGYSQGALGPFFGAPSLPLPGFDFNLRPLQRPRTCRAGPAVPAIGGGADRGASSRVSFDGADTVWNPA